MADVVISKLPRQPFLKHSATLFEHLFAHVDRHVNAQPAVLELGCGPNSPLVPILADLAPDVRLHQIDARQGVIEQARRHNPRGQVDCLFAHDMSPIAAESQDAVVAMSVYDQNPASALPRIAGELHRVLKPHGLVIYIHNEELNAPAMSASMLASGNRYLLPNDKWQPTSDLEYCTADRLSLDTHVKALGTDGRGLRHYLDVLHALSPPNLSANGKASVPLVGRLSPAVMQSLRETVHVLRADVAFADISTSQLMRNLVEQHLLTASHGFEVLQAGMFEIRHVVPWQQCFREQPAYSTFVRGMTKFGYRSNRDVPSQSEYIQDLNSMPAREGDDEILLVGYQYGVVARKRQLVD